MIKLSDDCSFEYMISSGALGFDGLGYAWDWPFRRLGLMDMRLFVVSGKTITYERKSGNRRWYDYTGFGCVRFLPHGTVNAVGLTNPGFGWWEEHIAPIVGHLREHYGIRLIFSVRGSPDEIEKMCKAANDVQELVAVEVNASCPNDKGNNQAVADQINAACSTSRHPVIAKVGAIYPIPDDVKPKAFTLNSVPWNAAFRLRRSPLRHLGGGAVSGLHAQEMNWKAVKKLKEMTDVPVVVPSIWRYRDIGLVREWFNADAISFGAIHLPVPWKPWTWDRPTRPTRWVRRDMRERQEQKDRALAAPVTD